MDFRQIDCFKTNMKFWILLGINPIKFNHSYFKYYSRIIVFVFVIIFDVLYTINFYFLPRELDIFAEEVIYYFTVMSTLSKVLTFFFKHNSIQKILDTLESEMFKPDNEVSAKIVDNAKEFIVKYWKVVAVISVVAHITHVLIPFFMHLFLAIPLLLPVSSYSFLSNDTREKFIYPLHCYQTIGVQFVMFYNINIDSFFLGLLILTIAQLKILDAKLRNITCNCGTAVEQINLSEKEASIELALTKCIIHYDEISKFCGLVQDVFSVTLFVQVGMASCVICVCLFRFTYPVSLFYFVFLSIYMTVMILQVMVPCWFGTRIIDTSTLLSTAIYNCDWIPRTRQFKSSLRLFVERANKPLSITGGKMFELSLRTFTSIMNSAYSFFTLLRHMQSRDL